MNRNLFTVALALAVGVSSFTAWAQTSAGPLALPKIDRRPAADDYSRLHGKLTKLPVYKPEAQDPFRNDLRSADLSRLDLFLLRFESRLLRGPESLRRKGNLHPSGHGILCQKKSRRWNRSDSGTGLLPCIRLRFELLDKQAFHGHLDAPFGHISHAHGAGRIREKASLFPWLSFVVFVHQALDGKFRRPLGAVLLPRSGHARNSTG